MLTQTERGRVRSSVQVPAEWAPLDQMYARCRLMVVDDMSVSRGIIAQALEMLGCNRVRTAPDARSALVAMRDDPADLVLADYHMPGMDGFGLLTRIRRTPELSQSRFVLVTGNNEPGLELRAGQLGVSAILWKPYAIADLRAVIQRSMLRPAQQAGPVRYTG